MRISPNRPKFIDLFAGCGGLSLGLMQSGWQGLFAIEKSPMAFETLKFNLIGHKDKFSFDWPSWLPIQAFDIHDVLATYANNLRSLQGIDLIAGGPPCQGFSMAGKRKVDDARNYLFEQYLAFVDLVKPRLILVENVRTFATPFTKTERGVNGKEIEHGFDANEELKTKLGKLGYKVFVKYPIMAKDFGVPQLRPRYILIAINNDLLVDDAIIDPFKILCVTRDKFLKHRGLPVESDVTLRQAISDLERIHGEVTCIEDGMKTFMQGIYGEAESPYQRLMRKHRNGMYIKPGQVADSHRFPNHKVSTIKRFELIVSKSRRGIQLRSDEIEAFGFKKHRIAPLAPEQACHTITSLPDDLIHYSELRIPTVREYARIQSFPDWFEFKSKYTSGGDRREVEVPRYTQVANAVPPLLACALGETLRHVLYDIKQYPIKDYSLI